MKTKYFYFYFKECDDDHFGYNCGEMCNGTCKSCNKTTGLCENGCYPGWKGIYCEEVKINIK